MFYRFFKDFLHHNYNVSRYRFLKNVSGSGSQVIFKIQTHILKNTSSILKNIQPLSLGMLSFPHDSLFFASITIKLPFVKKKKNSLFTFLCCFLGLSQIYLPLTSLLFNTPFSMFVVIMILSVLEFLFAFLI